MTLSPGSAAQGHLHVERHIPASPERVFAAWTQAEALQHWWGPKDVRCVAAQVDLRVGGRYRLGNKLPDGRLVWISGLFEVIEPAHRLVYTWVVDEAHADTQRVSVTFGKDGTGTLVAIDHRLIPTVEQHADHQQGWIGCMDGLVDFFPA